MNLQDPASQSLRPIGRLALTSVLLGEAFYIAREAEELKSLLDPFAVSHRETIIYTRLD
jgi:hypothetical protein